MLCQVLSSSSHVSYRIRQRHKGLPLVALKLSPRRHEVSDRTTLRCLNCKFVGVKVDVGRDVGVGRGVEEGGGEGWGVGVLHALHC